MEAPDGWVRLWPKDYIAEKLEGGMVRIISDGQYILMPVSHFEARYPGVLDNWYSGGPVNLDSIPSKANG